MLPALLVVAVVACLVAGPTWAADDPQVQRLATCQDAWNDWKEGDPRLKQFVAWFESRLRRNDDGAAFTPKSPLSAFGLPVNRPGNLGGALV